ncbi:uncharacterized protein LOC127359632 [Dicentrarchus labrax]|nr:uncharacterized protein LOC127359632 [Dicentrarchus labrax]
MRHTSVCGLLLLCVHFYFVNTGSSSHHVLRRETSPKSNHSARLGTSLEVSPTWYLSVGDTVEIKCYTHTDIKNNSDKMDLQLVWTKMGPGERTKKVLVSQQASKGFSYTLGPVTHEHQGVYTCDDDETLPDVYVHDWHRIIWVADDSPRASLDVISHNRTQFFHDEAFTVSCQLPDNNTQWKMMSFDDWLGNITECPNQVSSDRRLSCSGHSANPWSDVPYWCENPAGERSNALNISTTVVSVVMESPSLPVLEGEDVMLRCLHRSSTTNEITSNFRAIYYKNGRPIGHTTDGSIFTLKAVTKADEGVYKCRHPVDRDSPDSWITVKAGPDEDQKKKSDNKTS